jgi:hypothetical protein
MPFKKSWAPLRRLATTAVTLAALAGCGNQPATQSPASDQAVAPPPIRPSTTADIMPTGHPSMDKTLSHPASGKSQLKVTTPAAVAAKWKSVELDVQIAGASEQKIVVPIGGERKVFRTDLTLKIAAYLPAFKIQDGTATSSSNQPDNPAALVQLQGADGKITEGWVYQKFPQFDTFRSDRIQVKLLTASATAP